jgi:hypothetical protein
MSELILAVYEEQVRELAEGSVSRRMPNRKVAHAAILIEALFNNAKSEMRLLCGNLSPAFYMSEKVLSAIDSFLTRPNTSLKILLESSPEQNHKVVAHLMNSYADGRVEIKVLSPQVDGNIKHFAVMDLVGFRYEFSHDEHDSAVVEAVANFNEPETAKNLALSFDALFKVAQCV